MNTTLRDLALELIIDHGLTPEDIMSDGTIMVFTKGRGIHLTKRYAPLLNVTSDEIYKFEVNQK